MIISDELFNRMDAWRHLPNYQLERRADLLFSLYLTDALTEKLGFPVLNDLIPEFPVHIATIYPRKKTNKSFKIDYLALSESSEKAIFVELKTDDSSRRSTQDDYLNEAREKGLTKLLEGLLEIFRATNAKYKYFCLLEALSNIGLLNIPSELARLFSKKELSGLTELSYEIEITCKAVTSSIIYLQPNGNGPNILSFNDFRIIVEKYNDPISKRFAKSLKEWSQVKAGYK